VTVPDPGPTLADVLRRRAEQEPERVFLSVGAGVVSWERMHERARGVAAGLRALGVRAGDTVLLALGNRVEFVESWFGTAVAGAVEVPVNPDAVGARLAHVVAHSGARVAIVEPAMAGRLDALAAQVPALEHMVVVGDGEGRGGIPRTPFAELAGHPGEIPERVGREDELAAILYTSGSTGPPKGVLVPHGQHRANGVQAVEACGITRDDVLFLCLPLHHNMAQGYGIWPALLTGCRVRLTPRFDRGTFWSEVRAAGATVFPFVGGLLALLAAQTPRPDDRANPLRVAYGVPIPAALHRRVEERFGLRLVHGYGSTEATIPVWTREPAEPGAAGRVIPGYEVRVVDEQDAELGPDRVGEIVVRAQSPVGMFIGYHRDPDQTARARRGGWFHTGDRGRFDRSGQLWFCGRAGDAIRRFGEFVDADEVEDAALADADVEQVACFAVEDETAGQEVAVAVVPRAGAVLAPGLLRARLAGRQPPHAVPRYIDVVATLPTTPTGKVERYRLRDRGITPSTYDARARERQVQ
jgi:crotonobetaine/carnitine-CoA ligase